MATKPNFRSNAVSKVDLSGTLQRGALNRQLPDELEPQKPTRPIAPNIAERQAAVPTPRRQIDSRKKKLAHLKTLLEYEEKKEITNLLHELGDVVGHSLQFSIFNRGLLLAALERKEDFLRVAENFEGLERPSNGDVEAFREYEAQIGQIIFDAFGIRGEAPRRDK